MFFRPALKSAALTACLALTACEGEPAWNAPEWRPEAPAQRIVAGSVLAVESCPDVLPLVPLHGGCGGAIEVGGSPRGAWPQLHVSAARLWMSIEGGTLHSAALP